MPDREKVIKGLECCMKWTGEPNTATCHCSDCSYTNMDILGQRCLIDLINDALALLKEQEKPNGKCVNECECWDSAYERGKQDVLKEQEPMEPITQSSVYDPDTWFFVCGSCKKGVIERGDKFCRWCGQAVKWE